MTSSDAWDVVVLGSGIAGLAGALAAHELGLRPIVLEKGDTLTRLGPRGERNVEPTRRPKSSSVLA